MATVRASEVVPHGPLIQRMDNGRSAPRAVGSREELEASGRPYAEFMTGTGQLPHSPPTGLRESERWRDGSIFAARRFPPRGSRKVTIDHNGGFSRSPQRSRTLRHACALTMTPGGLLAFSTNRSWRVVKSSRLASRLRGRDQALDRNSPGAASARLERFSELVKRFSEKVAR